MKCIEIAVIGPYINCSIWRNGWGSLDPSTCFKLPLKRSIRIKCVEVALQEVEYVKVVDVCSHVDRSIRGNSRGRVNHVACFKLPLKRAVRVDCIEVLVS